MTRLAKAMSAFTNGRSDGRSFATRGASLTSGGSGAPAAVQALAPTSALRLPLMLGALLAAALLTFALAASPAYAAAPPHPPLENFGSANQPSFGEAAGMAVHQSSGDLVVIDLEDKTLSRFNEDGTASEFPALAGSNVIDGLPGGADETPQGEILGGGGPNEVQVAVDSSGTATDGNIYVTNSFSGVVDIFAPDGEHTGQLTESSGGAFGESCGVAVDEDGNVYVGDYGSGVHKFANPPVDGASEITIAASEPCTVAAGTGALYATTWFGEVTKFDAVSGAEDYVVSPGTNMTVSVDPGSGHVLAATGEEIVEYHAGADEATLVSSTELASEATGAAVNGATGNLYAARSGAANVEVFGPLPQPFHPPLENFGSANQPSFGEAAGMAVHQSSGDLVVIDLEDKTLSRFNEDGTASEFPALAGSNVIDGLPGGADETPQGEILGGGGPNEVQVAVDSSGTATDGNIYVTNSFSGVVDIFAPDGEHTGQLTESSGGAFGESCGVAVDEDGNVYVGDYGSGVHKFANPPVDGASEITIAASEPCTVAAGTGALYATTWFGEVTKFDAVSGAEDYVVSPGTNMTVSVDPGSGHVLAATGEEIVEYHAGADEATLVSSTELASEATGAAVNGATGNVYAARSGAANVEVFGPLNYGAQNFEFAVAKDGNGSGAVACEVEGGPAEPCPETATEYLEGTEITLTATPDADMAFTGWSGGGCSGTGTCEVTLGADTTVTANFEPLHTLDLAKTGAGTGTVTSAPAGIDCGSDCSEEYPEGTAITLTATPDADMAFTGWSGGGCSGAGTCEVTLGADTTVTANFEPLRTLDVAKTGAGTGTVTSAPAGIDCGSDCSEEYVDQTLVTLTGTPDADMAFTGWSGGGCSGTGTCEVTLGADTTVTANFEPLRTLDLAKTGAGTGTVTSAPAGIDCGSDCSEEYVDQTLVTLTGTEKASSSLPVIWSGCDNLTVANECEVTMDSARSATARFDLQSRSLSVAVGGGGAGTVTSEPSGDINCDATDGPDCEQIYGHGEVVLLVATPADANTQAVTWSGCSQVTADDRCWVTMTDDRNVTATFDLVSRHLSVAVAGSGAARVTSSPAGIDCDKDARPDCDQSYAHGASVTLAAAPAPGSEPAQWSGCDSLTAANGCVVAMNADRNVTAAVAQTPPAQCEDGIDNDGDGLIDFPPDPGCASSQDDEAGDPTASQPDPSPGQGGPLRAAGAGLLRGSLVSIRVRCAAAQRCAGVGKLYLKVRSRKVLIGSGRYGVAARRAALLRLRLNRRGRSLLRRAGKRSVKAILAGPGLQNRVVRVRRAGGTRGSRR